VTSEKTKGTVPKMKEKLVKMLAKYKRVPEGEIKTDVPFTELDIDSIDIAELIMQVEEELNINLEISKKYNTIDKLAEYIESKI